LIKSNSALTTARFRWVPPEALGIAVQDFADTALQAKRMPKFSYGCAVFLQSDIVNFQRLGSRPEE